MKKIPTLFKRDPDDMRRVLPEVTPGCEWVLAGEGIGTRKYDGTCVMFDGEWWARREVKPGKRAPENFRAEMTDETTGKTVGWEPIAQSGFAKWHAEALFDWATKAGEGPEHGTYELCGPKVNGNPEGFDEHVLISHRYAEVVLGPGGTYTFDVLREMVTLYCDAGGAEGIVWHHPDGRMAKLKARDFPRERTPALTEPGRSEPDA